MSTFARQDHPCYTKVTCSLSLVTRASADTAVIFSFLRIFNNWKESLLLLREPFDFDSELRPRSHPSRVWIFEVMASRPMSS